MPPSWRPRRASSRAVRMKSFMPASAEQKLEVNQPRSPIDHASHFLESMLGVEPPGANRPVVSVEPDRVGWPGPGDLLCLYQEAAAHAAPLCRGRDGHVSEIQRLPDRSKMLWRD